MNTLKLAVLYLVVLCITLLCTEVALRILASFPHDAKNFTHDENIGFRPRPNIPGHDGLKTNHLGFNDIDHTARPKEGSHRLAVVGDSFVYGVVARDKNFTFVLEDLAQQDGAALNVMNMGLVAAGPKNYLGLLKHDVANSNSDLVAVSIFIGNDITQAHPHFKTSIWLNSTRETLVKPYYVGCSWEYSYIYRSIRSAFRTVQERLDSTPRKSFTRETFMEIERQRSSIYKKDMSDFILESFNGVIELIEEMSQEAKRQNKQFFIILAPDEVQISSEIQDYLTTGYQLDPRDYDFEQPQSILTKELTKSGIAVLDLLPYFQNAKGKGELYLQYDTHWNDDGNRLAAEAIWRYINEKSLL